MLKPGQGQLARRGSLVALAAVGALCIGGGSSAMAADITGSAAAPVFTAAASQNNNLTVTQVGESVTFDDATETVTVDEVAVPGCANDALSPGDITGNVTCTVSVGNAINSITLNMGDGNDTTTLADVSVPTIQDGADGNDHLNGGGDADNLNGGDGNDNLDGGAGDDLLSGGIGSDDLLGGSGIDFADLSVPDNQSLTLDDARNDGANGENDNVHSDVEDANTNIGDDRIVGSAEANILFGDEGNDDITGGGGEDTLIGAGGNDSIRAEDGIVDTIACGPGTDELFADANDIVIDQPNADPALDERCETVHRPAATTGGGTSGSGTGSGTSVSGTPVPTPTGAAPVVVPALVAPLSVSAIVSPKRDRKRPYTFTIKGVVVLPAGVTKAQGCGSGTVKVTGKRGLKNAFAPKTVRLKKDCTYSATVTVTRKGRVKLAARFSGNSALKAKSSPTRTVRAG